MVACVVKYVTSSAILNSNRSRMTLSSPLSSWKSIWFLFVVLFCCCSSGCLVYGGEGPRTSSDRRLLPIWDLVGGESIQSFSRVGSDTIRADFISHKRWYDLDGQLLWRADIDADVVYSPETNQVIDFSVPGEISVRVPDSEGVVAEYSSHVIDETFLSGFITQGGDVCLSNYYPSGWVSFVPETGEVLWTEDKIAWRYRSLGMGSVLVRYTHLTYIPEANNRNFGPVNETLHHSLTGAPVLPDEVVSGWLIPYISPDGKAVYVGDSIWAVDTADGSYEEIGAVDGSVRERVAAQSIGGDVVVGLTVLDDGLETEQHRIVVWNVTGEKVDGYDWVESWGDPEEVVSLAVSGDGVAVLMGFEDGRILYLDTDMDETSVLRGVLPELFDPFHSASYDPSLYVVAGGERALIFDPEVVVSSGADARATVVDLETKETLVQVPLNWHYLWEVFPGEALYFDLDGAPRILDFSSLETRAFDDQSDPRISKVWPIDDEGMATVFFRDGTKQEFDSNSGAFVGTREDLLPASTFIVDSKPDLGLVVGSDGCVYEVDTGEIVFELEEMLEGDSLRDEYKDLVRELLSNSYLRAELLEDGGRVAFFISRSEEKESPGLVAAFEIESKAFVELKEYDWREVVEHTDFIVGVEYNRGINRGSPYRVGIFDPDNSLAEIYGIAADQSVRVAPDGAHFAVLSTAAEEIDDTSVYEVEVRLREFALEKNGFSELEPTLWKETYAAADFDLNVPVLLEYEGPGNAVMTYPMEGRALEIRSGSVSEWSELPYTSWYGSEVIDRTDEGRLLLLDSLGRLGVYSEFSPIAVVHDIVVNGDGFTEPDLTPFDLDRIEVWWSNDLNNWLEWDRAPIKVVPGSPVFFSVYEWRELE